MEETKNVTAGLIGITQAGEILHDQMRITMEHSKTKDKWAYIPPQWFKDLALTDLRSVLTYTARLPD